MDRHDDKFIFSFVRMNPPTPGHLDLIAKMVYKAIELNANKVYVLTSSTVDEKNPLVCSESTYPKPKTKKDIGIIDSIKLSDPIFKSYVLNNMIMNFKRQLVDSEEDEERREKIREMNINVVCSVGSPFAFIQNILDTDFLQKGIEKINMFLIVGSDRADFLDSLATYFRTKEYVESFDGLVLEREGMEEMIRASERGGLVNVSEMPISAYSASFVRNLVKSGNFDAFEIIYTPYIREPREIRKLFDTIKSSLASFQGEEVAEASSRSTTKRARKGGKKSRTKTGRTKSKRTKSRRMKARRTKSRKH